MKKRFWSFFKGFLGIALGLSLSLGLATLTHAQSSLRPEYVASLVYQRVPDIPKENQYIRQSTKEVDENNTLISRFIRYNQDVQKRPVIYRFDWKLAFADYLGANEPVKEESYPGRVTLTINPYPKDLEVIRSLNRRQRNDVVNALASIYNQTNQQPQPNPSPPSLQSPSSPPPTPQGPNFSRPGDSQLLKP